MQMEVILMNVIAINGSPRKNKNTATLLNNVLKGASSCGAETELIHLYDLNYKGCVSCFACKLKNGKSYGKCALKDDLTPVLEKISKADAIILGSPIYLHSVTGAMKSFLERLIFQYLVYDQEHSCLFQRKIPVGFIYTMNVTSEQFKAGYEDELKSVQTYISKTFGSFEALIVNDTYQFDDYSKYVAPLFDEKKKREVKEKQFPQDCQNAFNMGVRFVGQAHI
jgi:multimeric flavodoxin WrbA